MTLTLKVVSESRVTWATSVPELAFLGLSVLDLCPMYATDRRHTRIIRQTSDKRQTDRLQTDRIINGVGTNWGWGSWSPSHQLGGLRERRKLPERSLGQSPGRLRVFLYSEPSDCLSQHLSSVAYSLHG